MTSALDQDPERHARLLRLKLVALVRDHTGVAVDPPDASGATAAAIVVGGEGWFLADDLGSRGLGPALAWSRKVRAEQLHLIVDHETGAAGALARRAEPFTSPPTVWTAHGRVLERAEPEPLGEAIPVPKGIETLVELMHQAGLDILQDHGVVTGELLGLEVARVVAGLDGPRLAVGVGANDREAFTLLHGDLPRAEALGSVVAAARKARRADAPGHPLTRIAQEGWLRAILLAHPDLAGATQLTPVAPITPRASLKDTLPAAAIGVDGNGQDVVVVCSVGVDLDLVPEAADVRRREFPASADGVSLRLVLPERDALPATHALASALRSPAEVIALPGDWRRLVP